MKRFIMTLLLLVSLNFSVRAELAPAAASHEAKGFVSSVADSDQIQIPDTGATLRPVAVGQPAGAADTDGDGILDSSDNCTEIANVDQTDSDADSIGNRCDADIAPSPNDCQINFHDLAAMKIAFFATPDAANWNADADLNGDNNINFADLQSLRQSFFNRPGPSGLPNACSLGAGAVCDPAASLCGPGLTCCYPCGVPGCENVCEVTCNHGDPGCIDGCIVRP